MVLKTENLTPAQVLHTVGPPARTLWGAPSHRHGASPGHGRHGVEGVDGLQGGDGRPELGVLQADELGGAERHGGGFGGARQGETVWGVPAAPAGKGARTETETKEATEADTLCGGGHLPGGKATAWPPWKAVTGAWAPQNDNPPKNVQIWGFIILVFQNPLKCQKYPRRSAGKKTWTCPKGTSSPPGRRRPPWHLAGGESTPLGVGDTPPEARAPSKFKKIQKSFCLWWDRSVCGGIVSLRGGAWSHHCIWTTPVPDMGRGASEPAQTRRPGWPGTRLTTGNR